MSTETVTSLRERLLAHMERAEKAERERDEARAQAAAMRAAIARWLREEGIRNHRNVHNIDECEDLIAAAIETNEPLLAAVLTDAGRDIIDALEKAEAALREVSGWHFGTCHLMECQGCPTGGCDCGEGNRARALAAIQALGIGSSK